MLTQSTLPRIGRGYQAALLCFDSPFGLSRILPDTPGDGETPEGGGNDGGGTATATADPPTTTQAAESGQRGQGQGNVPEQFRPLIEAVSQRMDDRVEPISQRVQDLATQLQTLSTQAAGDSPRRIFGGKSPQATSGGTWGRLENQGYRYSRAYARQMGCQYLSEDSTKLEADVHNRLYQYYVGQSGMELGGNNSLLVPYGTSCIHEFEGGLGEELRQMIAVGISGADPSEIRQMLGQHLEEQGMRSGQLNQTLSMFDDTALGVFVSGGRDAEMIELVRNREVFSRAGASQITLPPNGHLPMNRQTGATTAYWVGENASINGSEPATGRIDMRARKIATLVTFPNELLRFATASVEAFLRMDIARVIALAVDLAFLEGNGSMTQPKGLLNYSGVVSFTPGTVSANGDTIEPEDPALMLAEIEERNHDLEVDEFTWCLRPKMWANIRNRRTSVYNGTDTSQLGQWLFETNRGDHTLGQQPILEGKRVLRSSQISNTRTKGSSSDLTYMLGGIFRHWITGNHGVMEFATSTQGDTTFAQDQSRLRAIRHVDGIPRYEDAFVFADTIDPDLPA